MADQYQFRLGDFVPFQYDPFASSVDGGSGQVAQGFQFAGDPSRFADSSSGLSNLLARIQQGGAQFFDTTDPRNPQRQLRTVGDSNYQLSFDPQTGQLVSVLEKTADREGVRTFYEPQNGQLVPVGQQPTYWNTNPGEENRALATVAGGALLGAALAPAAGASGGAAAAGGGAAAGTGATTSGGAGLLGGAAPSGTAVGGFGAEVAAPSIVGGAGGVGQFLSSNGGRLAAAGLGALAGGSGAGPQISSSTQTLPPHLQALQEQFTQRAAAPNPLQQQAEQTLLGTVRGDYLQGNPYLEGQIQRTTDDLQGRLNTSLLGSGSFGNANVTQAGVRGLAEAQNTLRFQNFDQERTRQLQAAGLAPGVVNAPFTPALGLLGSGGATTTSQQPGLSTGAGLLGGALAGAQLYNTWFNPQNPQQTGAQSQPVSRTNPLAY